MGLPKVIQFSGRPSQKMGGKRLLFSSFLPNIFPLLWWFFKSGKCTIKVLWDIEKSSNNGKNWRKALFFFLSTHFYNGYLHPPLKNTSVHTNKRICTIHLLCSICGYDSHHWIKVKSKLTRIWFESGIFDRLHTCLIWIHIDKNNSIYFFNFSGRRIAVENYPSHPKLRFHLYLFENSRSYSPNSTSYILQSDFTYVVPT